MFVWGELGATLAEGGPRRSNYKCDKVSQVYTYVKPYHIVGLKYVQLIIYQSQQRYIQCSMYVYIFTQTHI